MERTNRTVFSHVMDKSKYCIIEKTKEPKGGAYVHVNAQNIDVETQLRGIQNKLSKCMYQEQNKK